MLFLAGLLSCTEGAAPTGPGNAAWFMRSEIEPRVGGAFRLDFGQGVALTGDVSAWERTKLRLLNGMSTMAAPVTLSVDFSPVIEGTLTGQVSDEVELGGRLAATIRQRHPEILPAAVAATGEGAGAAMAIVAVGLADKSISKIRPVAGAAPST